MKTILICACLLAAPRAAFAQGVFHFEGGLFGSYAIPPNDSREFGDIIFRLQGHALFGGFGITTYGFRPVLGRLEYANGRAFFESSAFEPYIPAPETGYVVNESVHVDIVLSDEQRAAFLNQQVFATITSPAYPDGEIRGPILLVPEPGAPLIYTVGTLAVLLCRTVVRRTS